MDPEPGRDNGCFRPVARADALEDRMDVGLHRPDRYAKFAGDLLVRATACDASQDIALAFRQDGQRPGRRLGGPRFPFAALTVEPGLA